MYFYQVVYVFSLIYFTITSGFSLFKLQVESYVMDKFTINRETANGYGSINFKSGDFFKVYFCLRDETKVNLNNVRYSNDGGSDEIEFQIDGIRLGVLTSTPKSSFGHGWKNFRSTGPIGPNITLPSGRHLLTVGINKTDFYGIELDQIEIMTEDSSISEDIFKCTLFCDRDITYANGPSRDDMPSATLVRKIIPSNCPNNKNIILPVYHEDVDTFLVSVMHPKYRSFENNFNENGNCMLMNSTIWEFKGIELTMGHHTIFSELYEDVVAEYGQSNTSKSLYLKVNFNSSINNNDDTRLVLQLNHVVNVLFVSCKIKTASGWNILKNVYFTSQNTKHVWFIPKNSFTESSEVVLQLLVDPMEMEHLLIDNLRLDYYTPDHQTSSVLFSSYDTKIEVFTNEFEQFEVESMSVRNVDNNAKFTGISEIVVSHRLPWADVYSPIVKLSNTGEMNILPIAPHGLTKIPYGTSLVIGQNDPDDSYLSSPIKSIDITPESLQLAVTFQDGGSTNVLIKSTWKDTKVIFKDIISIRNPLLYPFATVMTTWNYDGNADVDHVSTNGDTVQHLVKGWDKLYGTSFAFFRQCLSRHNTQSPDMRLQILNEKDLYLYV